MQFASLASRRREDADVSLHASQGGKGANQAVGCWTLLSAQSDTRSGIPSTPVKALDTTGAGDCFVGALAAAMERGLEIEPAMPPRGGEYAFTLVGTAPSFPTGRAIDLMLDKAQWQSGKS